MFLLVTGCLLLRVAAEAAEVQNAEERPLTQTERQHMRGQSAFTIGEGFEGTASDWTEYVVWLIGVCGVFFYMANPNARRNLHAMEDDEPTRHEQEPQYEADGDDLFAAGTSPNGRAETSPGGNGQRPHYD